MFKYRFINVAIPNMYMHVVIRYIVLFASVVRLQKDCNLLMMWVGSNIVRYMHLFNTPRSSTFCWLLACALVTNWDSSGYKSCPRWLDEPLQPWRILPATGASKDTSNDTTHKMPPLVLRKRWTSRPSKPGFRRWKRPGAPRLPGVCRSHGN